MLNQNFTVMKTIRIFILAFIVALAAGSCKKDRIDSGPLAIEPSDFLKDKKYSSLVLEVAYVEGHQPTNEALNHLVGMLNERLNKPGGISIAYLPIASPRMSSFTISDLEKVEKTNRSRYTKGDRLAAFVFFANAPFAGDPNVLGVAYGTTSAAVFETRVEDYSGGIAQPSQYVLEATVAEHEFGHLLGLVDNGTPMVTAHLDTGHEHHCDNSSCLMYYAAETTDIAGNLTGGNIPGFDEHCIADLKANGGK